MSPSNLNVEPKRKRGRPKKQPDPNQPQKKKRKPGRPKKYRCKRQDPRKIKRRFDQTSVGHFLKYEAPLEYQLLTQIDISGAPSADLIEQLGYASLNPLFKKPKFRRALLEYRQTGLYPKKPKDPGISTELYYIRIRKNQK